MREYNQSAKTVLWVLLSAIITACSLPGDRPQDITLAPANLPTSNQASAALPTTSLGSVQAPASSQAPPYRVVSVVRTLPDCKMEVCPSITLKRLSFDGYERFNAFLETSLLNMGQVQSNQSKNFRTLSELAAHFWQSAENRYEIVLEATVKRATANFVLVEIQSYIYTGGAHGMSTVHYINWLPRIDKIVTLQDLLLPGRMKAFEAALKKQHRKWLETNDFASSDRAAYNKAWPFQFSDNAALMGDGIAITYDPYMLGPFALGMPTILVPFSELKGIVNPSLISKLNSP
jgi:hypothetical protein